MTYLDITSYKKLVANLEPLETNKSIFILVDYRSIHRDYTSKQINHILVSDCITFTMHINWFSLNKIDQKDLILHLLNLQNIITFDLLGVIKCLPSNIKFNVTESNIFDLHIALNLLPELEYSSSIKTVLYKRYKNNIHTELDRDLFKSLKLPQYQKELLVLTFLLSNLYEEIITLVSDHNLEKLISLEQKVNQIICTNIHNTFMVDEDKVKELLSHLLDKKYKLRSKLNQCFSHLSKRTILPNGSISTSKLNQYLNFLGLSESLLSDIEIQKRFKDEPVVKISKNLNRIESELSNIGTKLDFTTDPVTRRLKTEINQNGTATGRIVTSKYSYQSIPKQQRVRECFKAADGNKLIFGDYSHAELAIAADLSSDNRLISAINNREDIHKLTASNVLSKPIHNISTNERKLGKGLNFGILYGMGCKSLSETLMKQYGVNVGLTEAKQFIADFFEGYPDLKRWRNSIPTYGNYISRTRIGRRRFFSNESATKRWNTPIQSTGSDILKTAISLLYPSLNQVEGYLVGYIHDELILEVPEKYATDGRVLLEKCMKDAGNKILKQVTINVDTSIRDNWWS